MRLEQGGSKQGGYQHPLEHVSVLFLLAFPQQSYLRLEIGYKQRLNGVWQGK